MIAATRSRVLLPFSNYPFFLSHKSRRDYSLLTSLDAIHGFLSLFIHFHSKPHVDREMLHTLHFIVSFSSAFTADFASLPLLSAFASVSHCSFYARQDGFPFHRFQSLTVYCIIIMLMYARKDKRRGEREAETLCGSGTSIYLVSNLWSKKKGREAHQTFPSALGFFPLQLPLGWAFSLCKCDPSTWFPFQLPPARSPTPDFMSRALLGAFIANLSATCRTRHRKRAKAESLTSLFTVICASFVFVGGFNAHINTHTQPETSTVKQACQLR